MDECNSKSGSEWERNGRPYTPYRSLIGGSGVAQPGQSEQLGDQNGARLPRATLLNLTCPDMYAAQVTIVLGTPTLLLPLAAGREQETPPLFARVTYGVGGTQTSIEVDWINGASFNIPAAFLRLDALLDFDQFAAIPPVGDMPRVNVPAFCGYYPVGQALPPQRSRLVGALGVDVESAPVPIAEHANGISALTDVQGTVCTVRQYADLAGLVLLAAEDYMPGGRPVVLANGARFASFEPDDAATVRAVFSLSI